MVPGMKALGHDFGNGPADAGPLIRDREFEEYREAKREALRTPRRCLLHEPLPKGLDQAILERLELRAGSLDDALLEMQEDLAVVVRDPDGTDRAIFLGVCLPSRWAPETKFGRSFFAIHEEIPGFVRANAGAAGLVAAIVERGPYVRFVWSLETTRQLNLHPTIAPERDFLSGELFARVERQVTLPFPEWNAAAFLIRVLRYPVGRLAKEDREAMATAILGMPPEIAAYKGLLGSQETVAVRLRALGQAEGTGDDLRN